MLVPSDTDSSQIVRCRSVTGCRKTENGSADRAYFHSATPDLLRYTAKQAII